MSKVTAARTLKKDGTARKHGIKDLCPRNVQMSGHKSTGAWANRSSSY